MSEERNEINPEVTQVIEKLYTGYIRTLAAAGIPKWSFEMIPDQAPSITFKPIASDYKVSRNIAGGGRAELPFSISIQTESAEEADLFEIYRIFYDLAEQFRVETNQNFPHLTLTELIPESLEMVTAPASVKEPGMARSIFAAEYRFTYRMKGKVE